MKFSGTIITAISLACASLSAQAATVSFGALTSNNDGSTEIIYDSLNNREWLRFDVLADLTYDQTVAAVGAGGAYQGWSIADNFKAQSFADAILTGRTNNCTASSNGTCATSLAVDFQPLLGTNFDGSTSVAWFLGSNSGVGYLQGLDTGATSSLVKYSSSTTFATSDDFASGGSNANEPISWLVYRDIPPVPLPASGVLLICALGGLGFAARRRKAA